MPSYVWLVPVLPIVGLLLILLATWRSPRLSGFAAIVTIGAACLLSVLALVGAVGQPASGPPVAVVTSFPWLVAGPVTLSLGAIFDPLAAVMLVVVTFVSLLVQVYSQGYMDGDPGYSR